MTAKTYFILPIAALLSACSGVGYSNGNDTSFERQGVASCNASSIVAVGTSLPELVSSFFAIHAGEAIFVVDNIIGSNIANFP